MRVPFGRYRDTPLDQPPHAYLHWLARTTWIRGPLRYCAQAELTRRARETTPTPKRLPLDDLPEAS